MGTLSSCLKKIGLSKHEAAILRGATDDNIKDGDEAHVAAVRAVADYIEQLEKERAAIVVQVDKAGGVAPDAPFKLADLVKQTSVLRNDSQVNTGNDTAAETETEPKAEPAKIEDFGEKLEGARKFMPKSLDRELSDDDIASQPLSKIWPADEIDGMENKFAAAIALTARGYIPAKPRKDYLVKRWVEKVKIVRNIAKTVSDGAVSEDQFKSKLFEFNGLDGFKDKVALLEAIDRDQWKRIGEVRSYPTAYRYGENSEKIPSPVVRVEIDGNSNQFDDASSVADVIEKVNGLLGVEAQAKKMQFEVRGRNSSFSINKAGDKEYRKLKTFDSSKEAFAYIKNNYGDLVAEWDKVKERDNVTKADMRNAENRPRTGQDWREGKDVTEQQFAETMGFRGVQFGNWVGQGAGGKDWQGMLNQAYDALMDLANIIGVPPKAISLNGSLGLSFGARGSGNAAAHFEPDSLVINLTKTKGAGSLAHEFFHALDNYFSRQRGGEVKIKRGLNAQQAYRNQNYITYRPEPMYVHKSGRSTPMTKAQLERMRAENPKSGYFAEENWHVDPAHPKGVRPEVERAFAELVEALDESPMKARSAMNDKAVDGYWSRIIERGARAFENYVIAKMMENGYHNDYLANVKSVDDFPRAKERYPYLMPEEVKPISDAFDNLFATVETKETDSGVAIYNKTDGRIPDDKQLSESAIVALIEPILEKFGGADIPVRILESESHLLPVGVGMNDDQVSSGVVFQGRIHLFRDGLADEAAVVRTLFHEMFHYGIRRFMSKAQYIEAMQKLYNSDATIRNVANAWLNTKEAKELYAKTNDGDYVTARGVDEALADVAAEIKSRNISGLTIFNKKDMSAFEKIKNWLSWVASKFGFDGVADMLKAKSADVKIEQATRDFVLSMFDRLAAGESPQDALRDWAYSDPAFMTAWHGSPHDHDGFTTAKIGTGEGAQAYGWGLYFASSKGVAEWYRENLTRNAFKVTEKQFIEAIAERFPSDNKIGKAARTSANLYSLGFKIGVRGNADAIRLGVLKSIADEAISLGVAIDDIYNPGKLYQVELAPKEHQYLDWDKPFEDQSDYVTNQLDALGYDWGNPNDSGGDFYKRLSQELGGYKEASDFLYDAAGIRGIRYLDGTSRGAGEGSHNYVIFSDDDVSITAKYSKGDSASGTPITERQATDRIASMLGDVSAKALIDGGWISFANLGEGKQGATFNDGRIVLNLDALTESNFDGVLKHEGLHSTLKSLVGEKTYGQLLKQLENNLKAAKGNEWVKQAHQRAIAAKTKAEDVTEEIAAYAVEAVTNGDKTPNFIKRWVDSLLSAIRTALIRGMAGEKAKAWAVEHVNPEDLARLAIAGLKAKARNELASQGRDAMAFSFKRAFAGQYEEKQFVVPETDAYTNDQSLVDLAYFNGKPIRLQIGSHKGKYGIMHLLGNAAENKARQADSVTDDDAENMARDVVRLLGQQTLIGHVEEGGKYVLRSPLIGKSLIIRDAGSFWTVQTVLPSAENKWGVEDWKGRLTLPSPALSGNAAPETEQNTENNRIGASAGRGVTSTKFNPSDVGDKRQVDVAVKKRRIIVRGGDERLSATGNTGDFDGGNPDIRYSKASHGQDNPVNNGMSGKTISESIANAAESIVENAKPKNIKDWLKAQLTQRRPFMMGFLTLDQIADLYGKKMGSVNEFANEVQAMDTEKQRLTDEADKIVERWRQIGEAEADKLADVMHEATLIQYDPDLYLPDDEASDRTYFEPMAFYRPKNPQEDLYNKFIALSPEAQQIYRDTRDSYKRTIEQVRDGLANRVERAGSMGGRIAAEIRLEFDGYLEQGPYFPLARFGDFILVSDNGKVDGRIVESFESVLERDKMKAQRIKEGYKASEIKETTKQAYSSAKDGAAGKFAQDVLKHVSAMDMDAEAKAALMDDLNQLAITNLPDQSYRKHFMHRKGVAGFSKDAMRAFANGQFHAAHHIAKINHADKLSFLIDEITEEARATKSGDVTEPLQVANELKLRLDDIVNPKTGQVAAAAGQLGFVMSLGGNLASGVTNLTQTPLITFPWLGSKFGFDKAASAMTKASKDYFGGKWDKWSGYVMESNPSLTDGERKMLKALQDGGKIDLTQAHDLASVANQNSAQSKGAYARSRAMKIIGWTFHLPEVFNRQVSALAAYRLATGSGMSHNDAINYASKTIDRTHFNYSSSNRARFMNGDFMRVLTMFKQYSQQMTYLLWRNAYQALKGESPEVRREARRMLAGVLTMQFMAAGSLGLPLGAFGISTILLPIAAMSLGDGDDPWEWEVEYRKMLADVFGTKGGEVIAHGALRAVIPWADFASRVGMGDLWFRPPAKELEGRAEVEAWMQTLAGPVVGYVGNVGTAAKLFSEGNMTRGVEAMLPKMVSAPLKAIRYATDGVQSMKGDDLGIRLDPADIAFTAAGFNPSDVAEMYEARNAIKNREHVLTLRRKQLINQWHHARKAGDAEGVAEAMADIGKFNKANSDTKSLKITPGTLAKSSAMQERNAKQIRMGAYLTKGKESLREEGAFADVNES